MGRYDDSGQKAKQTIDSNPCDPRRHWNAALAKGAPEIPPVLGACAGNSATSYHTSAVKLS